VRKASSQLIAFSLVEVTLALGILAMAALVIVGLLPTGLASLRNGNLEETATEILSSVAADMRRPDTREDASPLFGVFSLDDAPAAVVLFFNGSGSLVPTKEDAVFQFEATPCTDDNPRLAIWHVTVSWPPQAAVPAISVENVVILNRY